MAPLSTADFQDQPNKKSGSDVLCENMLFILAVGLTLVATRSLVFFWNILVGTMAQFINVAILFTEPVPECIQYKKRMVFGSVLLLAMLGAILYINYSKEHRAAKLLKQFMSIDIILMEGIFTYRLGFSFFHFLFGAAETGTSGGDLAESAP